MEQKNRLLIVVAVTVLIIGAMFTSFGRSLFALNTPSVVLPDPDLAGSESITGDVQSSPEHYQQVEVTEQTVQNVIATMARPDSYYREITVETFWPDGSSSLAVQVWHDEGWTHTRTILTSGTIRHELSGDGMLYYWYEGSRQYESAPGAPHTADLSQHIPTYETVLELETDQIRTAGYGFLESLPCILIEVCRDDPNRLERYWIGLDSGLLVSAEMQEGEQVVYRMTGISNITSCPATASFSLPDGTVLHALS